MIELENIRLEQGKKWTKLVVDIKAESSLKLPENTMWFALPNENADKKVLYLFGFQLCANVKNL